MSTSINKVILVGNVGKDPEVRFTQAGNAVANLSVATSDNWRDKATGERRERTEWHRVTIFNEQLAKICQAYVKKGTRIYIEGQLQTRKFTDQSGQEKYSTEVVLQGFNCHLIMMGGGPATEQAPRPLPHGAAEASQNFRPRPPVRGNDPISTGRAVHDLDDDIPF